MRPSSALKAVPYGKLVGRGLQIVAEDGSFTLSSGQIFRPPFSVGSLSWVVGPSSQYSRRQAYHLRVSLGDQYGASRCFAGYCVTRLGSPLNRVDEALRLGARKVKVYVPGRSRPLYGVLWLGRAPVAATGPESRSYLIRIAGHYIGAASGGRTSVVYEKIPFRVSPTSSMQGEVYGWILWMSDVPLGR